MVAAMGMQWAANSLVTEGAYRVLGETNNKNACQHCITR